MTTGKYINFLAFPWFVRWALWVLILQTKISFEVDDNRGSVAQNLYLHFLLPPHGQRPFTCTQWELDQLKLQRRRSSFSPIAWFCDWLKVNYSRRFASK